MKKIINHLLKCPNMSAPLFDVEDKCSLSKEQIISLVKPYTCISISEENNMSYTPPFGIKDKSTLCEAIENAFPLGIPYKVLNSCYEFCYSDFNEMMYDGKIYIHKFGKTEEKIIFRQYDEVHPKIYDLWCNSLK
tara:strand:+ start:104 stop:508 length:405 start_codon:yes stop_codon:yes gene_type:complete